MELPRKLDGHFSGMVHALAIEVIFAARPLHQKHLATIRVIDDEDRISWGRLRVLPSPRLTFACSTLTITHQSVAPLNGARVEKLHQPNHLRPRLEEDLFLFTFAGSLSLPLLPPASVLSSLRRLNLS